MKECELCNLVARMYCESDEANLCWNCDAKVHGANFLVARHSRSLLCQICQAVTAWRTSGSNPGPTVSVCEKCVAKNRGNEENNDENQVVPLASGVSGPPASCSCTGEEEQQGETEEEEAHSSPLKRRHETFDLGTSEGCDHGCSSSGPVNIWPNSSRSGCDDDATSVVVRRYKRRKEECLDSGGVVETIERIHRQGSSSSSVSAICKLCNDSCPRELVSMDSPRDG